MNDSNNNIDSGTNSDNIGVRLDTLADILDHDIKRYDSTSNKIGNLYEIDDSARVNGYREDHPIRVAIKHEIDTLQTECDYWAGRNDANYKRYNDDLWTYGDLYGDYIPERGEDWHPDWGTSVQYDAPESNWDAVSRHDMNEGW
jgi:hypothetical protein